jgi:hypothetical protein
MKTIYYAILFRKSVILLKNHLGACRRREG